MYTSRAIMVISDNQSLAEAVLDLAELLTQCHYGFVSGQLEHYHWLNARTAYQDTMDELDRRHKLVKGCNAINWL